MYLFAITVGCLLLGYAYGLDPMLLTAFAVAAVLFQLGTLTRKSSSKPKAENTPVSTPDGKPKKQSPYQAKIEEALEAARSEEKRRQADLSERVLTGRTSTDGTSRY